MTMTPFPDNLDSNRQGEAIPGTESADASAFYKNSIWGPKELRVAPDGTTQPGSLYQIFEQSVARHPNQAMFRSRILNPATKPGEAPSYSTKTQDTTYGQVQQRRNAVGSALLNSERLGRLRDPNVPADLPSPPEIKQDGIPSYGDRLNAGARRGWAVGIWSGNREEWQIVDLACQAYGLVSVSLYETLGPDTAEYITNHCPLPLIFSSSNHSADLLRIAPRCPSLRVIVTMDTSAPAERDVLTQWAGSLGILLLDQVEMEQWGVQPGNFITPGPPKGEEQLDIDRIVTISYTSGTTGNPKGVILTNWNMTSATVSNSLGVSPFFEKEGWKFFSYLPLSHVYERFSQVLVIYGNGIICLTTGNTSQLLEDAQIFKPNFFPGVPRVWNRINAAVMIQMKEPGLKGALSRKAVQTKLANFRATGAITHRSYDTLVFRKSRALTGGEVVYMSSGAAPSSASVHEMLKICFSCDVIQGYGLTETVGTATKGIPEDPNAIGTTGQIQPCNEIKLVDVAEMGYTHKDSPNPRGEVCIRGTNIFKGYLHDPENTAKTIDPDGWMHTGDIGEIDAAGRLKIVDRVKNVVKLSQGEYVASEKVEGVYALNPIYATLVVHGDSLRSSLVAIAVLEPALASKSVSDVLGEKIDPTDVDASDRAVKDKKVRAKLVEGFARVAKQNKSNGFEFIKGVFPTVQPFPEHLLTPTQKVKRNVAAKHFGAEIDALYDEIEGSGHAKL